MDVDDGVLLVVDLYVVVELDLDAVVELDGLELGNGVTKVGFSVVVEDILLPR